MAISTSRIWHIARSGQREVGASVQSSRQYVCTWVPGLSTWSKLISKATIIYSASFNIWKRIYHPVTLGLSELLLALEVVRGVFCNKTRGHDFFFYRFRFSRIYQSHFNYSCEKNHKLNFFQVAIGHRWTDLNSKKSGFSEWKKKQNTTLLSLIFNQVKK